MTKFSKSIFAAAAMTFALAANAATVVQAPILSNIATDVEENDGDLFFAKFDSSLGTLTSVKFELINTLYGTIDITNTGATGSGIKSFTVTAGGQIDGDASGHTLSAIGSYTHNVSLTGGATDHFVLTPWTATDTLTFTSSSDLATFSGNGDYHALLTGWSTQVSSGTGNAAYNPAILMDGQAKITYTYATLPVPEPETYAMLLAGLGLVGAIARRRKSV